jgi:NAD-dependent deacetylase
MPQISVTPKFIPPKDARIVILTGAGISKESGLDTFRDAGGIWSQVRVEDVATPEAFARDPERVRAFYNMRRRRHHGLEFAPNAAHAALVKLEQMWPGEVIIITQNVDELHDRAGSKNLIHMHGVIANIRCNYCGHAERSAEDISADIFCAACKRVGGARPDVVWFGETPLELDRIADVLSDCDLFISIGTSGNVYPAAGFVSAVRRNGTHTTELNLEPSEGARVFAEAHYGPATEVVPAYVEAVLKAL